jgi:N-acetylmuramoyl-L-alanine amidase CwlA
MIRILKRGSAGSDVSILQRALGGLVIDGIFGQKTEDKVKEYQAEHGLAVDGIVGEKTWGCLFPDDALKPINQIDIAKGYINTHITHSPNRPIKYIAIHYTAGASSKGGSAMGVRGVFLKRNASADFVVDDTTILQINPDPCNYYCWAVGDKKNPYTKGGKLYGIATNKNTISIEICSNLEKGTSASAPNHEGWYYTEESLENAVKLVRYLMLKYSIPKSNVVRHYDISGKLCPGVKGWNNGQLYSKDGKQTEWYNDSSEWLKFVGRL